MNLIRTSCSLYCDREGMRIGVGKSPSLLTLRHQNKEEGRGHLLEPARALVQQHCGVGLLCLDADPIDPVAVVTVAVERLAEVDNQPLDLTYCGRLGAGLDRATVIGQSAPRSAQGSTTPYPPARCGRHRGHTVPQPRSIENNIKVAPKLYLQALLHHSRNFADRLVPQIVDPLLR